MTGAVAPSFNGINSGLQIAHNEGVLNYFNTGNYGENKPEAISTNALV